MSVPNIVKQCLHVCLHDVRVVLHGVGGGRVLAVHHALHAAAVHGHLAAHLLRARLTRRAALALAQLHRLLLVLHLRSDQ